MDFVKAYINICRLYRKDLKHCPRGLEVGLDAFERGLSGRAVLGDIPEPGEVIPPGLK